MIIKADNFTLFGMQNAMVHFICTHMVNSIGLV
jgi:hypothetical protein